MMRSPTSARRCTSVVRVLITTRCAKRGRGEPFDIVRNGKLAAFEQCQRLHGAVQGLRTARAHAQSQGFMVACLLHDGEHVIHQGVFHRHAVHRLLQPQNVFGQKPRRNGTRQFAIRIAQDFALAGGIGVSNPQPHRETVNCDSGSG